MRYTKPTIMDLNSSARAAGFDPWSCLTGNGANGELLCQVGNGAKASCSVGNSFKDTYAGCNPGTSPTGYDCVSGTGATPYFCVSGSVGVAESSCIVGPSAV
jgi:hypothetical protein